MTESEKNITGTEGELISINNGDIVVDKKGGYGIIQGIEDTSHGEMVKVKFSDYEGFYPKHRFGEDMQIIPRQQFEVPNGETLEHYLKQLEDEAKYKISKETLQSYIEQHQPHNIEDLGLIITNNDQKERLTKILQDSIKRNCVFRGDAGHPYAQGKFDKSENIIKGVFEIGFREGGQYGKGVFVTADITKAKYYPDVEDMSSDWDQKRYIYFIDSKVIFDMISSINLRWIRNSELECENIPAESIPYAICVDGQSNKLLKIFKNPKALK